VNPGAVGETSGILGNQFNNRANRGLSDFDRRHRFVLSGVWEVPTPGNPVPCAGGLLRPGLHSNRFQRKYAAKIPGAEVAVIEISRHVAPMDQPKAFNHLVLDFLSRAQT